MNLVSLAPSGCIPSTPVTAARPPDGGFEVILDAFGTGSGQPISAPLQADRPDPMLLQQLRRDQDGRRDRKQLRRGQDMLALLARMQRDLLDGDDAPTIDRAAEELLDSLPAAEGDAADASLAGIVRAIALRLKVELARRGSVPR